MGVEMPSRKDDPDARLTIGYSSYCLPRSGLVQREFLRAASTWFRSGTTRHGLRCSLLSRGNLLAIPGFKRVPDKVRLFLEGELTAS